MLGAVPRATTALPVRQRLAVLHSGQRVAVHDRRLLLLLLVDSQPDPVQPDVDEVQESVPGDAVRVLGRPAEPDVQGPAVELPGHDHTAEHDHQHRRLQPQVGGSPIHQKPAGRTAASPSTSPSPIRGCAAFRRLRRRQLWPSVHVRRDGDDLAGQRERAVLQNVAQCDRTGPGQQGHRRATRQLQQQQGATAAAGLRKAADDR